MCRLQARHTEPSVEDMPALTWGMDHPAEVECDGVSCGWENAALSGVQTLRPAADTESIYVTTADLPPGQCGDGAAVA